MKRLNIFLIFLLFLSIIGNVNAANENTDHDRNLLDEKAKYYHDEYGDEGIIVKLDVSKLKHGDYIQLKNFKDEALVYSLKDSNGYVYFSDTYGSYYCKQEDFNKWYTGYALLIH
jgi:hypothetical protein